MLSGAQMIIYTIVSYLDYHGETLHGVTTNLELAEQIFEKNKDRGDETTLDAFDENSNFIECIKSSGKRYG